MGGGGWEENKSIIDWGGQIRSDQVKSLNRPGRETRPQQVEAIKMYDGSIIRM